jgi:hypothetical protein
VIAVCDDACGTASTYACTGPSVSATVGGCAGIWPAHALLNSAEFAMSGTLPPAGTVHVHTGDGVAPPGIHTGSSAIDGANDITVDAAIGAAL